jgi:hypothetical protein
MFIEEVAVHVLNGQPLQPDEVRALPHEAPQVMSALVKCLRKVAADKTRRSGEKNVDRQEFLKTMWRAWPPLQLTLRGQSSIFKKILTRNFRLREHLRLIFPRMHVADPRLLSPSRSLSASQSASSAYH